MTLPLLSLAGWSIIPDFATRQLISILHRFAIFTTPRDQPTYRRQYASVFAVVVLGYLSYTLYESAFSLPPNFYEVLGVRPDVDAQGLKIAFRQFAKKYHPDRVGKEGAEMFIAVRDVYEALKDPVVRFAYDRFGPDVLTWSKHCTTTRDYIQQGLLQSSGYHVFVIAALFFWSFVGSTFSRGPPNAPDPVSFWRCLLYASLFVAEIGLVLSPTPPSPLQKSTPSPPGLATTYTTRTFLHLLFPQRIIHQHIRFLHQLFIFLSIALTRVVPVVVAGFGSPDPNANGHVNKETLQAITQLTAVADREASMMAHTALHSVASPSLLHSTSDPTSVHAQPHEDLSSFARPRPFKIPPGVPGIPPASFPLNSLDAVRSLALDLDLSTQINPHPLTRLVREMEELIIEANIKKDEGPFRSIWEAAVRRGRALLEGRWMPTKQVKEDTRVLEEVGIITGMVRKPSGGPGGLGMLRRPTVPRQRSVSL